MSTTQLVSDVVEIGDFWEWDALVRANDWTDGLPVAPPTEERVQAIIDYLGLDPQHEIGKIAPAYGLATVEQVAIQSAMAGCVPEHVPVVIAAIEAMLDPAWNLHGVQSTTNPCAPLAIVSGPIARELNFNVGNGAFGGGGFANVAIGRAIRLVLWNIGGGKPAVNDMSPIGSPAKFAFCVAENVAQSPWPELHVDRGFAPEENAVTVVACNAPYPAVISGTPKRILSVLAEGMASTTINMFHAAGQMVVVLAIKPAVELAAAGYTKEDVRQFLFDHGRLSVRHLRECGALDGPLVDSSMIYWGETSLADVRPNVEELDDDVMLPMVKRPEDIIILVTGGDTQFWGAYCPGWGAYGGFATTRPITLPA